MTQAQYSIIHVIAAVVLCVSGLIATRLYYKYLKVYGRDVSAIEQVRRLMAEGKRDGYVALVCNVIGILSGVVLLILTFLRR
ncbi:hypothetical protein L2Y94_09740 [Luteibacter aegosomatis]|uniref:hypothetical protein n=1 Tax=Luteibacter aegosomatis TaxID=2911537 RepID=UPI001FF80CF4|nr:hypothetical protein [Luteibacter aegosomatis]UPG87610.1 hypothetical protein L2Y94_09740 [Luteibacter aegosomatis]